MNSPFGKHLYVEGANQEVICPVFSIPYSFKTDRMKFFAGRYELDERRMFPWQCVKSIQHLVSFTSKALFFCILPQVRNIRLTPQVIIMSRMPRKAKVQHQPLQHVVA